MKRNSGIVILLVLLIIGSLTLGGIGIYSSKNNVGDSTSSESVDDDSPKKVKYNERDMLQRAKINTFMDQVVSIANTATKQAMADNLYSDQEETIEVCYYKGNDTVIQNKCNELELSMDKNTNYYINVDINNFNVTKLIVINNGIGIKDEDILGIDYHSYTTDDVLQLSISDFDKYVTDMN